MAYKPYNFDFKPYSNPYSQTLKLPLTYDPRDNSFSLPLQRHLGMD